MYMFIHTIHGQSNNFGHNTRLYMSYSNIYGLFFPQSETEAVLMETNILVGEIVTALDNLQNWAAPKHQPKDLLNKFNSVYLQPEPYGVLLNISAWNFPFQLTLSPLIGAIAAGEANKLKGWGGGGSFWSVDKVDSEFISPKYYIVICR